MNAENFAEFVTSLGHTVRLAGGAYWYDAHPHVYLNFPFHECVDSRQIVVSEVLGWDGWAMRYCCPAEQGRPSYRIVCNSKAYDLSMLNGKARNQTRRGLESCVVERVTFRSVMESGASLFNETLKRQGRLDAAKNTNRWWKQYCLCAEAAKGAEVWTAHVGGMLAAYLVAFRIGRCANILLMRSATEYLPKYPNNALLYTYLSNTLRDEAVDEVSIGIESIQDDMQSLDRFKLSMGFSTVQIGQRVEFSRWFRPIMSPPLVNVAAWALQVSGRESARQKLIGMRKFYVTQPKK